MVIKVDDPFPVINDLDGLPLEAGFVYIGVFGLDPEGNPKQAYWDSDLTVVAAQPIRTIAGRFADAGSQIGTLYVAGAYSILVQDKDLQTVVSEDVERVYSFSKKPFVTFQGDGRTGPYPLDFVPADLGALEVLVDGIDNTYLEDFTIDAMPSAPSGFGLQFIGLAPTAIMHIKVRYSVTVGEDAPVFLDPLLKTGGTMGGALILAGDPTVDLGAATKQYVDDSVIPSAKFYGAVLDGMTDDSDAYLALAATGAPVLDFGTGTAVISKQLTILPTTKVIKFGNLTLDYTALVSRGGNFADAAAVYFEGDARVALPALSVSPVKYTTSLTFATAPSVVVGDIIEISDPTDFSFNGARDYYRNGIRCEVRSISGSVVQLVDPLVSAFDHTVVTVAKFPKSSIKFQGGRLHLAVNNVLDWGVLVRRGYDVDYSNITATGPKLAGIAGREVQKVRGSNVVGRQDNNVSNNTQYGAYFVCAQDLDMEGEWSGEQHGVTLSGGANDVEIPNRWCYFRGKFTVIDETTDTLGAFSPHGNSEFWDIEGDFFGGVNFGGDFGTVRGNIYVSGATRTSLSATELVGFNFDLSGITIINGPGVNPGTDFRGVIDIDGNSSGSLNANTLRGGVLKLDGIVVYCEDAGVVLRWRNWGCTQEMKISMRGMKVMECAGTQVGRFGVETGVNLAALDMEGLEYPANLSFLNGAVVDKIRGWSEAGSATVATTTGVSQVAVTQTYARACPKTPTVTVSATSAIGAGGKRYVAGAQNVAATTFDVLLGTADNANFASAVSETVSWIAVLDER